MELSPVQYTRKGTALFPTPDDIILYCIQLRTAIVPSYNSVFFGIRLGFIIDQHRGLKILVWS